MKKAFILLNVVIFLASCAKTEKVGYVQIQKVFNDFQYKKELERELTEVKNHRKFILDSLAAEIRILDRKITLDKKNQDLIARFNLQKDIYYEKKADFETDEARIVKLYDEKIISQLNSYVKLYGNENKYTMIYGANSTGNIMYADSALDITSQVTAYVNKKFSGK
jgi:outer membrane protein